MIFSTSSTSSIGIGRSAFTVIDTTGNRHIIWVSAFRKAVATSCSTLSAEQVNPMCKMPYLIDKLTVWVCRARDLAPTDQVGDAWQGSEPANHFSRSCLWLCWRTGARVPGIQDDLIHLSPRGCRNIGGWEKAHQGVGDCLIEIVGTRKVSAAGQLEHEVGVVVERLKCTENREL